MRIHKTGREVIIANIILLVVLILSILTYQNWFQGFFSETIQDIDQKTSQTESEVEIMSLVSGNIFINFFEGAYLSKIELEGKDCKITGEYSGIEEFPLIKCYDETQNGIVKITVVTNKNAFSRTFYLNSENILFSRMILERNYTTDFISIWNTSKSGLSNSTTIALPLYAGGTYNFEIDWGDNTSEIITSYNQSIHTYQNPGIYTINITGHIEGFRFNNQGDRNKIIEIEKWGPLLVGNQGNYFYGCTNLIYSGSDTLNVSEVSNMSNFFRDATNFRGDISTWDTSEATTLNSFFRNNINFDSSIYYWDTSKVEDISFMFRGASMFNQDLSYWETDSLKFANSAFLGATVFDQDLSSWNTTKVEDMSFMFSGANSFNGNINSWDTQSVTDMSNMFWVSNSFNQNITSWDTQLVTDMTNMFRGTLVFDQDLSSWNTNNVLNCSNYDLGAVSWSSPKPNFLFC